MTSTTALTPLRYDSPTVTLEVMAREAAVSQWSDKPIVQVLRYQLQVRDPHGEVPPVEIRGDCAAFVPLMAAVQDYVHAQLTGAAEEGDRASHEPYLEPHGLTQHRLHLGNPRTGTGETDVVLGAVQLADLADVFEQLDQAVRPLPVPLVSTAQRPAWRQWGAAAAGIVAAVGITTVLWPNYETQQRLETAQEAPTAESAPSTAAQNELDERSPQPATAPEAETDTADAPPPDDVAADAQPSSEQDAPTAENRAPDVADAPVPSASRPAESSAADGATPARPAPPASPETADAPTADRPSGASTPRSATRQPAASAPNSVPAPPTEPVPEGGRAAETDAAAGIAAEAAPDTFSLEDSQRLTPTPELRSRAALVEQLRDRWAPPADLDQPLSYTLVFSADGTLADVIPDSDVAAAYQDQAGIPPIGTVRLPAGSPRQMQLLLLPDGSVELQELMPDPSATR